MNCEECGSAFEPSKSIQRFCSAGCQRKAERRRYKQKKMAEGSWNKGSCTSKKKKQLVPQSFTCSWCDSEFQSIHPMQRYCGIECNAEAKSRRRNFRSFGGTIDQFKDLVEANEGRCEICGGYQGLDLCCDHSHATERPRGLLCKKCNSGVGFFCDDPNLLQRAIEYLNLRDV